MFILINHRKINYSNRTEKITKMEEHSFPILEVSALLKDMSDLEIQVSREELIRPTLSSCLRIYSNFLLELLGISLDSLEMNFDILQELEAPNLHSESLYIMSFYRKVYKLLEDIGIQDFNFNEFLNPDKKRLLYILSGLINFSKFRQEKLQLFSSCSSKGEEYLSAKEALESKKSVILDGLNNTRQKRQEEEKDVQDVRTLVLKIGTENRELKKQLSKLESENEGLSLHERELSDKMVKEICVILDQYSSLTK